MPGPTLEHGTTATAKSSEIVVVGNTRPRSSAAAAATARGISPPPPPPPPPPPAPPPLVPTCRTTSGAPRSAHALRQGLTLVHSSAQLERFLWDKGLRKGCVARVKGV